MNFRTSFLAVAAALGICQAANAATIVEADLWLRYEGTAFSNLTHASTIDPDYEYQGDLAAGDTLPGVQSYLFGPMTVGDIVRLSIKIVHPDVPVLDDRYYGNGGRTPVCQFGAWDCTETNSTQFIDKGFALAFDDKWSMKIGTQVGDGATVNFWSTYVSSPIVSDDGEFVYWYGDEDSFFTVVPPPSPVPLPAAAALLPMGIGALAVLRRRRRKAD